MIISTTKGRKIKINNEILEHIYKYRQVAESDLEAGGIVIGREIIENNNLIIEYITEPYSNDRRDKFRFKRIDKRHVEYFESVYERFNGIHVYVGEWHTHPEDIPNYSSIDLNNWKKIRKYKDNKVYNYHFIAGRKNFRIWEVSTEITLIIDVCWDDVGKEKNVNNEYFKD